MIELYFPQLLAAAGIFLFTLLCVNKILFGPFVRMMREREKRTVGELEESDRLLRRSQQLTRDYETLINNEKLESYRQLEERRAAALARRAERVKEARQAAEGMIADAKKEIAAQAEVVKTSLQSEAQSIAAAISRALLGRELR